jgi:hypothetical protein
MSGLEVEGYIVTGTVIGCLLAKAAKWLFEELQPMVVEYQKLRETIKKASHDLKIRSVPEPLVISASKHSPSLPPGNETRTKDEPGLVA